MIDVFSKFGWIVPLKDKTGKTVANAFKKIFKKKRIPKFLWTDKGKEFFNKNTKSLLDQHNIKLCSTENEKKSSVVKRWNRTIKNKMWKQFTKQGSTQYLDMLPEIVDKYNNSYHSSVKMTPVQASEKENQGIVYYNLYAKIKPIKTKAKFKVGDTVRLSKYKRNFLTRVLLQTGQRNCF